MAILDLISSHWLVAGVALWILTVCVVLVQRLLLSPIANVPGPKLAAATGLVEMYYDIIKGGQYVFKIEEWHKTYGSTHTWIKPYLD